MEKDGFMDQGLSIVILAAGKGSRMQHGTPKPLIPILGIPMIQHILNILPSNVKTYIVINPMYQDLFVRYIGKQNYLNQTNLKGTAGALIENLDTLSQYSSCIILNGDTPFVPRSLISSLISSPNSDIIVSFNTDQKNQYGQIKLDQNQAIQVVEAADRCEDISSLYYSGVMKLSNTYLNLLPNIPPSPITSEYYLTHIVTKHTPFCIMNSEDTFLHGVNTFEELQRYESMIKSIIFDLLNKNGVNLENRASTLIHPCVQVGENSHISSNVRLTGLTKIGANTIIGQGSIINNSNIGANCNILPYSIIQDSCIAQQTNIGPFAHIQSSNIGPHSQIGNYVEIKRSYISHHVKAKHLSYLGDAYIDHHANISAGVITCNYVPWQKTKSISYVGCNAFVGTGCYLIAPAHIGDFAICAAGSVVNKPVIPKALFISRPKYKTIPNWLDRKSKTP